MSKTLKIKIKIHNHQKTETRWITYQISKVILEKHSGTITEGDLDQITENEIPTIIEVTMEEINNAIDSAIRGNTILESLTNVRITRPKRL